MRVASVLSLPAMMLAALCLAIAPDVRWRNTRNITNLRHVAYVVPYGNDSDKLLVSRFGAMPFFGRSAVSIVDVSKGSPPSHVDLTTSIDWPNVPTPLAPGVFGFPAVAVGSGFLVPTHTTGAVSIVDTTVPPQPSSLAQPVSITKKKKDWFYHRAWPIDMNGDGLTDFITSRASLGSRQGELLWLEQPQQDPLGGGPWAEHHIAWGPDFVFDARLESGSATAHPTISVCAAEYFGEKLVLVTGSVSAGFKTQLLDADLGPGFACTWTDLNGDGQSDLLVTNHKQVNGSVYAYTWHGGEAKSPGHPLPTQVLPTRHLLATGFSAVSKATGKASPGQAIAFFPRTEPKPEGGKPMIALSADNANAFYMLVPRRPEDQSDWTYDATLLAELPRSDIGGIAVADTNRDGMNEIFVAAYDLGALLQFDQVPAHSAVGVASE